MRLRRDERLTVLVVGLALGAWIAAHAHTRVRAVTALEWVVLAVLLVGVLVILATPPRPRGPS